MAGEAVPGGRTGEVMLPHAMSLLTAVAGWWWCRGDEARTVCPDLQLVQVQEVHGE